MAPQLFSCVKIKKDAEFFIWLTLEIYHDGEEVGAVVELPQHLGVAVLQRFLHLGGFEQLLRHGPHQVQLQRRVVEISEHYFKKSTKSLI